MFRRYVARPLRSSHAVHSPQTRPRAMSLVRPPEIASFPFQSPAPLLYVPCSQQQPLRPSQKNTQHVLVDQSMMIVRHDACFSIQQLTSSILSSLEFTYKKEQWMSSVFVRHSVQLRPVFNSYLRFHACRLRTTEAPKTLSHLFPTNCRTSLLPYHAGSNPRMTIPHNYAATRTHRKRRLSTCVWWTLHTLRPT